MFSPRTLFLIRYIPRMSEGKKLHIVMFPWLAFGHIIPFFELSKYLAQKGHHISFVSTPRNIQRLPKIPQNLASSVSLVELRLAPVENLPLEAEATIDLPYDKVQFLKKAYDGLEQPMKEFLETSPPNWIVYDFACHWLPPIAAKLAIRQAFFSIFNACALCFVLASAGLSNGGGGSSDDSRWLTLPTNVTFRPYEILKILMEDGENASGVKDMFRLASVIKDCDVIAVRSCIELEPTYLRLFQEFQAPKPVLPLGLMPSTENENEDDDDENNGAWHTIRRWLDQHDQKSVVYVAFGTEATQNQEEITEVALGLELSKLPFFWVLKKRVGLAVPVLPDGFEDRTNDRGLVWTSWAPQVKILSHRSIGGFLTHCGWSSTIEGLQFGRPLIMLPFFIDQGLNARVMGEKRVGVEIPRDEDDGTFSKNSVAETIRLVVLDEGGKIYRETAREASAMVGDQSLHRQYLENFEKYLRTQ